MLHHPSQRSRPKRTGWDLEERTLAFAGAVIHFVSKFPGSDSARVIGRQLLRSGTSIGANYREANRAESASDFAHKVAISVKEAAETEYWLLLYSRSGVDDPAKATSLLREVDELLAILTTILRRARRQS